MATVEYNDFKNLLRHRAWSEAVDLAERQLAQQAAGRGQAFWLTQLARALRQAGRQDDAMAAADEALALAPSDPYAAMSRADILRDRQKWDDALADYRIACGDRRTRAVGLHGALACLAGKEDWQAVLQAAGDGALPARLRALWRTRALARLGRADQAESVAREGLAETPDDPQLLWELIELEIQRDGIDGVLARLRRLARIPSRPAVYGEIYATLCRRAGCPEDELRQYERLADRSPNPRLAAKRAFALARNGHEGEAIPIFEELLLDRPTDMYLNNAYAGACRRMGELARAVAFYDRLIERHPGVGALHGRRKRLAGRL